MGVRSARCARCGKRITIERGQRFCSIECQMNAARETTVSKA